MKKWLRGIIVCLLGVTVLGGCQQPLPKITKKQQNNIVTRIARSYKIHSIEFLEFNRNPNTGTYFLNIRLNNKDSLQTTIPFRDLQRLENNTDEIGLNPINAFKELKRPTILPANEVRIDAIDIIYIGN